MEIDPMDDDIVIGAIKESFTVTITRFTRNGEELAVIHIDVPNGYPSMESYCDKREIIDKAYYQAQYEARKAINYAGLGIKAGNKK